LSFKDYCPSGKFPSKPAVQPARLAPLTENRSVQGNGSMERIMDVPRNVSVELGRTRKTIKEILELSQGSIIALNKQAGEPVDLLVNGKLIAGGEVIIVDDTYGIRITVILNQKEKSVGVKDRI